MIAGIQVLRAVAALVVTICHAQFEFSRIGELPAAMPAATLDGLAGFGVQLFFVISGFVMVYASEPLFGSWRGSFVFMERRLVRIVPLYWIVTTLYLALTLLIAKFHKPYSPGFVVASYLFIPAARPDGIVEPLVGQGWSLNYEMLFYFVFALTVPSVRRISVGIVSAVLIVAVAAGQSIHPLPFIIAVWTSPLLLHFVFGMWIGLGYREGLRLNQLQGLVLVAVGCILLLVQFYGPPRLPAFDLVFWCIPAIIVAGVSLTGMSFKGPVWSLLIVIGASSYALYLFHAVAIRVLYYFALWLGFDIGRALLACVSSAVLISIVFAVAIHYFVEKPLLKTLRWRNPAQSPTGGTSRQSATTARTPEFPLRQVEEPT
jgi:exopolysaccharide production protein ExoZ